MAFKSASQTSLVVADSASCRVCGNSKHRVIGSKLGYSYKQCRQCGSILTSSNGTASLTELYDHYYDHAQFETPAIVVASLEHLVCSFEPFRSTGRWLDVGYGEGGLLNIVERQGWNCYGTEVSPAALEYGNRKGWIVTAKPESDLRFPQRGFDVVTMIELLEHVPSPEQFLQSAAEWLRPGGLLYVTTPNAQSLNRRFLGLDWSVFAPPDHLTIWTARGLRCALAKAGFQVSRVRTEGFNPCEILARLKRRDLTAEPINRNQAALQLNNAFSSSPLRRAVKTVINHGLNAFRIGDCLKVWALRSDDVVLK